MNPIEKIEQGLHLLKPHINGHKTALDLIHEGLTTLKTPSTQEDVFTKSLNALDDFLINHPEEAKQIAEEVKRHHTPQYEEEQDDLVTIRVSKLLLRNNRNLEQALEYTMNNLKRAYKDLEKCEKENADLKDLALRLSKNNPTQKPKIQVTEISRYRDGGTVLYADKDGHRYYVDNRISTPTPGRITDKYPDEPNTRVLDIELEILSNFP